MTSHVNDEIARVDAWVTNFRAGPQSTWRIEFATDDRYREEIFQCTDNLGFVYELIVCQKRFLTPPTDPTNPDEWASSQLVRAWGTDLHPPTTIHG